MKKRLPVGVAAVALVGLMAAFATSAQAYPTKTTACAGCHSRDAAVAVTATEVSNNGTTAVYSVSVRNPYGASGWAVFSGAGAKLGGAAGTGGTVSVPVGSSYTAYGVSVGSGNGLGSLTLSPAAPSGTVPGTTPGTGTTTGTDASTPAVHTVNVTVKLGHRGNKGLTAVLTNTATGTKYTAKVGKRGRVTFSAVADGTYKLTVQGKKFRFKTRTIVVR